MHSIGHETLPNQNGNLKIPSQAKSVIRSTDHCYYGVNNSGRTFFIVYILSMGVYAQVLPHGLFCTDTRPGRVQLLPGKFIGTKCLFLRNFIEKDFFKNLDLFLGNQLEV